MAKTGRPPALDDLKRKQFFALVSMGFSAESAARSLGCAPLTLRRIANRDPAFREGWRNAELTAVLKPLDALKNEACTNWKAAIWFLERVYASRFEKQQTKYLSLPAIKSMAQETVDEVVGAIPDDETRKEVRRRLDRLGKLWERDWRVNKTLKNRRRTSPARRPRPVAMPPEQPSVAPQDLTPPPADSPSSSPATETDVNGTKLDLNSPKRDVNAT